MKGYDKIGCYGQMIFDRAHAKHLASMGSAERQKYGRNQVKSIKPNNSERCLEVRFPNNELFKYTPSITWY